MYVRHKFDENLKKLDSIKDEDLVSSRKWDGGAYFLAIDGSGNPSFISRRESVKGGHPDKINRLPHIAEVTFPKEFHNHVFYSEAIHTGKDSSPDAIESHPTVSGIMNSLPARAIEQQKLHGPVRVVIHDVIEPKLNTFGEKVSLMKALEETINKPDILRSAQFKIGLEQFKSLVKNTKEQGIEGVIATSLTKPEHENPRIKIKHTKTANLRIKGITQEVDKSGNPKQSAGAVVVEDADGQEVATVGMGFTREQRIDIWNNKTKWMKRPIQVKYQDVAQRRLRSPVYNGDSDGDLDRFSDL